MKFSTILIMLLVLTACPKKETKSIEEIEREAALRQLIELPEEDLDDLPEASGETDDDEN